MMSLEDAKYHLTGMVMSVFTPCNRDGSIDYRGMANQIDRGIENGSRSVILTAGDSLYTVFTDQDVREITKFVVDHVAGRAMVVAADRSWWLGAEVEFAKWVSEIGADMLMALPPDWAGSCSAEGIVEYYAAVAEHIPVMLVTNVLGARGMDFGMTVLEMVRDNVDGVIAVKDDICGELGQRLGLLGHDHWAIIAALKQNHFDMVHYGCDGCMSNFIILEPSVANKYWEAIEGDDWGTAAQVIGEYERPLCDFGLTMPGGLDAVIHGALELLGICERWRRKPYHSLTDEEMEKLSEFFGGLSLL